MNRTFIRYALTAACKFGMRGGIIDATREGRPLEYLGAQKQVVADLSRELLLNCKVYRARSMLAPPSRALLTPTDLIACCAKRAYIMNTDELEAPEYATEPRLPV